MRKPTPEAEVPGWVKILQASADRRLATLEKITFVGGKSLYELRPKPFE